MGAADQVAAVDMFSTSPPEAAQKEQIDAFELNVEAVAALEPDLVILAFDPGDAVGGFAALDIPVLLFDAPTDLDGAYSQWEVLGAATGRVAEAASLVAETSTSVDRAVEKVPPAGASGHLLLRARPNACTPPPLAPSSARCSHDSGWRTSPTPPTPTGPGFPSYRPKR